MNRGTTTRSPIATRWTEAAFALLATLALIMAGVGAPPSAAAQTVPGADAAAVPGADVGVLEPGVPASGDPSQPIRGLVDAHSHLTAGVAFGGKLRCGRPFAPGGIGEAMASCDTHTGIREGAILQAILDGSDFPTGPNGHPTFENWPKHNTLLSEQAYYTGIERAWRGGLRVINTYLVANRVICELYPAWGKTSCNEMAQIRTQVDHLRKMEAYIDQQHGGPGRGWFRIATSPAQVRQFAAEGKLAVTMGVEASEIFGCREIRDMPLCAPWDIDRGLDEFERLGISTVVPIHKFDNAFGGARFDEGLSGAAINVGNALSTGHFWQARPCTGAADNEQPLRQDLVHQVLGGGSVGLPAGAVVPVYPEGPSCNVRGLTRLGERMINGLMDRGMLINIDHMSIKTARDTLALTERRGYRGVISDHTWADPELVHRVRDNGGFLASYGFTSHGAHEDEPETFLGDWRRAVDGATRPIAGYGYGSDVNGLAPQAPPREDAATDPLPYPFTAANGALMDRQTVGERTYDLNTDGVAHYGLYADWIADILHTAGADRPELERQLMGGAEAWTALWEKPRTR